MGKRHRQRKPRTITVQSPAVAPTLFEHAAAIEYALRSVPQNWQAPFRHGARIVFPQPQVVGVRSAIVETGDGRYVGVGRVETDTGQGSSAPMHPQLEQDVRLRLVDHDAAQGGRDVDLGVRSVM